MLLIEIILISVGLAMDAFAVSVCKGICMKKISVKKCIIIGLYFGLFQAIMPTIGYYCGSTFSREIIKVDHWIAFILLSFIGINMIKESFSKEYSKSDDKVDFKTMILLSLATSIDALAVGVTLSFFSVDLLFIVLSIGIITLILSIIGVILGHKFGMKYEKISRLLGGSILIVIGVKILIEHFKGL